MHWAKQRNCGFLSLHSRRERTWRHVCECMFHAGGLYRVNERYRLHRHTHFRKERHLCNYLISRQLIKYPDQFQSLGSAPSVVEWHRNESCSHWSLISWFCKHSDWLVSVTRRHCQALCLFVRNKYCTTNLVLLALTSLRVYLELNWSGWFDKLLAKPTFRFGMDFCGWTQEHSMVRQHLSSLSLTWLKGRYSLDNRSTGLIFGSRGTQVNLIFDPFTRSSAAGGLVHCLSMSRKCGEVSYLAQFTQELFDVMRYASISATRSWACIRARQLLYRIILLIASWYNDRSMTEPNFIDPPLFFTCCRLSLHVGENGRSLVSNAYVRLRLVWDAIQSVRYKSAFETDRGPSLKQTTTVVPVLSSFHVTLYSSARSKLALGHGRTLRSIDGVPPLTPWLSTKSFSQRWSQREWL